MSKSTRTPHTHTAVTKSDLTITFSASGCMQHTVNIPKGTMCRKLDGGSDPWVVADLSFIENKRGFLYSDADIYGIRVPESDLEDIQEVARSYERPRM